MLPFLRRMNGSTDLDETSQKIFNKYFFMESFVFMESKAYKNTKLRSPNKIFY